MTASSPWPRIWSSGGRTRCRACAADATTWNALWADVHAHQAGAHDHCRHGVAGLVEGIRTERVGDRHRVIPVL